MVPYSHTRPPPTVNEMILSGDEVAKAVSMDLEPGDAVVWQRQFLLPGSFPRQIPGIRMNLAVFFARHFVVPQEHHRNSVPKKYSSETQITNGFTDYWEGNGPTGGARS